MGGREQLEEEVLLIIHYLGYANNKRLRIAELKLVSMGKGYDIC